MSCFSSYECTIPSSFFFLFGDSFEGPDDALQIYIKTHYTNHLLNSTYAGNVSHVNTEKNNFKKCLKNTLKGKNISMRLQV